MNGVEQNELNFNEQLFDAARSGDLEIIKGAIENDVDVNAKDTFDFTLLHWAVRAGHLTVVKYLIEKGANINVKDRDDCTPLHFAAGGDNLEIVEFLIINGANVNAKDESGNTPLHWAANGDNLEIVKCLSESKNADINAKDKKSCTPLHEAACAGKLNVVEFLIRKNANINAEDKDGNTPLHLAAHKGHLNVAEFLIKHTLLNPSAEQLHFSQEELKTYRTKCVKELIKLEQENPGLVDFLYTKSFKEGVKIWEQNKSILEDEVSLKEQCPEYAYVLLYKATECKGVTSFGKFFAKHDVAFKVVGGLSLLAGAAFCAYGFLAAGLPLLILGILAFGLSTDIGWGMCERVSSKFNDAGIAQPAKPVEATIPTATFL